MGWGWDRDEDGDGTEMKMGMGWGLGRDGDGDMDGMGIGMGWDSAHHPSSQELWGHTTPRHPPHPQYFCSRWQVKASQC